MIKQRLFFENSHFGLGQFVHEFQLAFSDLNNFLNETSTDLVLNIRNSNRYISPNLFNCAQLWL
jgi:hypothetical protein